MLKDVVWNYGNLTATQKAEVNMALALRLLQKLWPEKFRFWPKSRSARDTGAGTPNRLQGAIPMITNTTMVPDVQQSSAAFKSAQDKWPMCLFWSWDRVHQFGCPPCIWARDGQLPLSGESLDP